MRADHGFLMSLRLDSDESGYGTPRMRFIKPLAWIPQPKRKDAYKEQKDLTLFSCYGR